MTRDFPLLRRIGWPFPAGILRPRALRPFGVTGGGSTDYAVDVGQTVTVTVTVTNAQGAVEPYTFTVDWGDGSTPYNSGRVSPGVSGGQVQWGGITHQYSSPSSSNRIAATVTDAWGGTGGASKTIQVYAVVACGSISGPSSVVAGQSGTWSCSASGGSGTQYAWNWGDGTTTGDDTTPGGGASGTVSHTYSSPGTYTITFYALDAQQNGCQTTMSVTVTSVLSASISASPQSQTGTYRSVSFTGSASGGTGSGYSYAWNFGDPNPNAVCTHYGEPAGCNPNTSTSQSASHTYAGASTYTVTLTVTDSSGATATATIQVTT